MAMPPSLSAADADAAFAAAQRVVRVHERLSREVGGGMTLAQVDALVARLLEELECRSCFLGYVVAGHPPFPSHACLSLNDCVVHGHAAYHREPLRAGDLLKIDIGVWFRGWVGDAAWTYSVGEPAPGVRRLMECGKEALRRGVETLRPGAPYMDWAQTVQDCVEREYGFHCIENWGGHGIGKKVDEKSRRGLHLPPHLLNHRPKAGSPWEEATNRWQAGNLLAVEPMIAEGTGKTLQKKFAYNARQHDWPVFTADGSLAVHYEHDVLITQAGPRVLTEGLEAVGDVLG